jgi:hypothetical protein
MRPSIVGGDGWERQRGGDAAQAQERSGDVARAKHRSDRRSRHWLRSFHHLRARALGRCPGLHPVSHFYARNS